MSERLPEHELPPETSVDQYLRRLGIVPSDQPEFVIVELPDDSVELPIQ